MFKLEYFIVNRRRILLLCLNKLNEKSRTTNLGSSNVNEVIRSVLNFLLFFYERFYTHQKAPKVQKHNQTKKHKNANKRTKIKNALRNI